MEIRFTRQELALFKKISRAADELGLPTYLIGGFIRDKLLGRPTTDADVMCLGDGIALAHKVAQEFDPVPHVDFFKTYGTAHIRIHLSAAKKENEESLATIPFDIEFVGARKESYTEESRNPHVEPGSLLDDMNRRDFTINALAMRLNKDFFGQILDPFKGRKHLEKGIIKTPLEPGHTFSDDPLRILRAIRFASQLGFTIDEVTLQGIIDNKERIKIITAERIATELNKIILSPKPSIGFQLLFDTGLLDLIFPQMVALSGAEYKDGIGHKDNFTHTLQVLDNVASKSDDLWLRWAAILHDIGKPPTKRFEGGHGWTFHGHEVVGGRMVPKIFARFKLSQHEPMRFVRKLVELHLRPISLTKDNITDSAIRRLLFDAGDDFDSLMILCEADITSKNERKVKRYLENFQLVRERCRQLEEKDHIRNWQPPVNGEQIMEKFSLPPSKPVGVLKDSLKDAILDGLVENNEQAAWQFLIEKAATLGIEPAPAVK